jgi:hypothetical protein
MLSARKKHRVYRNALAFVLISVFSLSTIFSPLVKAEALPSYAWKDIVIPNGHFSESKISPDGSKLFVLQAVPGSSSKRQLIVSEDDGVSWNTFVAPDRAYGLMVSADGSKLIIRGKYGENSIYVSTDGGRNWIKAASPVSNSDNLFMSPDGAILAKYVYATEDLFVSNDDGQTWIQKGKEDPSAIFNGGKMIRMDQDVNLVKKSVDYGVTWTTISSGVADEVSFSTNGSSVFNGNKVSLDGGSSWTSTSVIPGKQSDSIVSELGISNDGKKLFAVFEPSGHSPSWAPVAYSVDGGKTWQQWGSESFEGRNISMSSDGSKIFAMSTTGVYRLATVPIPQSRSFDVSVKPTPTNTDDSVAKSIISTNSLYCYDINSSSVYSLSADDITVADSQVKILGGLRFKVNCQNITTGLGSSNITISLAGQYDVSKIRIYKKNIAGELQNVTSRFTIKNESAAGRMLTTVSYIAVDADDNDSDGSVNDIISGVFYFGVVNDIVSIPSTTTTPSTGSSSSGTSAAATPSSTSSKKPEKSSSNLAETGISVWAVGGLAIVAIAVGGLALRKRL